MARYVAGRFVQAAISILFIATAVFLLVRLTGDPAQLLIPDSATIAQEEAIRTRLGLDTPVPQQYVAFIGGLITLDLGTSFSGRPVVDVLMQHLPATVTLALAALTVAIVIAVPLGILSALYRGTALDTVARTIALLGQSVPSFWLAIMLILVFGVILRWFPVAHQTGPESYVLPAMAVGLAPVAGIVRLMRSSMLEVLESDYILMAKAKGLPINAIVTRHALRNAMIPVLTFAALVLGAFMNGSVVVENVFAWPGIGKVVLDSVRARDFPVVQGIVILTAAFYVIINLLVDLLYVVIDPRIRYR